MRARLRDRRVRPRYRPGLGGGMSGGPVGHGRDSSHRVARRGRKVGRVWVKLIHALADDEGPAPRHPRPIRRIRCHWGLSPGHTTPSDWDRSPSSCSTSRSAGGSKTVSCPACSGHPGPPALVPSVPGATHLLGDLGSPHARSGSGAPPPGPTGRAHPQAGRSHPRTRDGTAHLLDSWFEAQGATIQ